MCVATEIVFDHRLPGRPDGGRFITFDWDDMFKTLRVDAEGRLWWRFEGVAGTEPGEWTACFWSGELGLQPCGTDDGGKYVSRFVQGVLQGTRPGWDNPWARSVGTPEGGWQQVITACSLHGTQAGPGDIMTRPEARLMEAVGLPMAPPGQSWVITASGDLHQRSADNTSVAPEQFHHSEPWPLHGWVFLRDPAGMLPLQAARYAAGRRQWMVLVDRDGQAVTPHTLAQTRPRAEDGEIADARHATLLAACHILPTDYTDYGGDAVRWELDDDGDPDCSCGCRWFQLLHDPGHSGADADWGVCTNPASPRCGLLTWEHQAGRGCFEQGSS